MLAFDIILLMVLISLRTPSKSVILWNFLWDALTLGSCPGKSDLEPIVVIFNLG